MDDAVGAENANVVGVARIGLESAAVGTAWVGVAAEIDVAAEEVVANVVVAEVVVVNFADVENVDVVTVVVVVAAAVDDDVPYDDRDPCGVCRDDDRGSSLSWTWRNANLSPTCPQPFRRSTICRNPKYESL